MVVSSHFNTIHPASQPPHDGICCAYAQLSAAKTNYSIVMKLLEYGGIEIVHAVKFGRWQHHAVWLWTRFAKHNVAC